MIEKYWIRRFTAAGFVAASVLIASGLPVRAQATGRCYSADVSAGMVLPGGAEHPPGTIKVCLTRKLSPVETRHRLYVDGVLLGEYSGRFEVTEAIGRQDGAYFLFLRDTDDQLVLDGYVVSQGTKRVSFGLRRGAHVTAKWRPTPELKAALSHNVVLIASR